MRIDPHVHFRDEEQGYKETITHGLLVAKEQGINYVFDMPNTLKPILRGDDVKRRLKLVPEEEKERYFLYIGATADEEQLREAIMLVKNVREVIGIKMFAGKSTGDLAIIDEEEQKKVYEVLAKNNYKGVIAVHCEKESHTKDLFDPNDAHTHALSRPNIAEIESIKDQIKFSKQSNFKGTLHICHVSCKESVELVDKARKEITITCGATPHHLLWDDKMLKGSHGLLYKMNPPLRSEEDVKALREYLKQGKIDWIETDHAPHAIGEKMYRDHPSGYPTLYLYKRFVEEFLPSIGLTEEQIKDLTFNNIAKVFGILR
jgi:dihydroorotase